MGEAAEKPAERFYAHPEEYFHWEEQAEHRHEYVEGEVIAMAGGTERHATIASNVNGELRTHLRGKGCRVYSGDLKLDIPAHTSFFYPDGMVICGDPTFYQDRQDTVENPRVVIEILSPSTEAFDRGKKFQLYQSVPSLQEYVLISQEEARVEVFRRQGENRWELRIFEGLGNTVSLASLSVEIALSYLYENVKLPPPAAPEEDQASQS
jgi:Uma2 family endonuclease